MSGGRIVEAQWHSALSGYGGKLGENVLAVGRAGDLVAGIGRVEHAEAVVMLGSEHNVALAGGLGQADPVVRLELNGIEP
jgi:hypothetical protein